MKTWIATIVFGAGLLVLAGSQYVTIQQLRSDVAYLKGCVGAVEPVGAVEVAAAGGDSSPEAAGPRTVSAVRRGPDPAVDARLLVIEQQLVELREMSDHLMERGQAPLTQGKANALAQSLFDPATEERDHINAVRLLVRNGRFDDASAAQAASLLAGMTDSRLKREMLDQLRQATNAVLKSPLLQLASTDADENVRERAVQGLARFASDPQVQQQLWNSLRDPEADVRRNAESALRRLSPNDAILAQARERGLSPDSTLEERFVALRILQNGKQDLPELANALAQASLDNQNPDLRLDIIRGFDDLSHPSFVPPLVQSLQDPNPRVREEAADALSGFRSDPVVNQWLEHVAQTDTDPRVRSEASSALGRGRGRGR